MHAAVRLIVLLLMLAPFSSAQLTFAKQASSCLAIDYPIPENLIVKRVLLVPGAQPAIYYDANTQYVSALSLGSIPHAAVPQRYGVLPEENGTYAQVLAEVGAANEKIAQAKRDALLAGDASVVAHCKLLCILSCPRFCDAVQAGSAAMRAAAAKRALQESKDSLMHAIGAARSALKLAADGTQSLELAGAADYSGFASGVYGELAEAAAGFAGGSQAFATACGRAGDVAAAFGTSYYNKTALAFAERDEFALLFNSLVEDSTQSIVGSAISLHKKTSEALSSMERDYSLAQQSAGEETWSLDAELKRMRDERYDAVDDGTLAFVRSQSQYAPQLRISATAPLASSPRERMHDVDVRIGDAKAFMQNAKQTYEKNGGGYAAKAVGKLATALETLREARAIADATDGAMESALAASESLAREKRDESADALQRFAPSGSIILLNDANALYREAEALMQSSRDAYASGEKILYNAEALRRFVKIAGMLSNPQEALAAGRFGAKEALESMRNALSLAVRDGIDAYAEQMLLRELDEAYSAALKYDEYYNFQVIGSQAGTAEKSLRERALLARAPPIEKLRRDALAQYGLLADAGYGNEDVRAALERWDAFFDAGGLQDALGSYNLMEGAYKSALGQMRDYARQHIGEIMSAAAADVEFVAPRIDEEATAYVRMRFRAPLSYDAPLAVRTELPQYLSGFKIRPVYLPQSIADASVSGGVASVRFRSVGQGETYAALFNATGIIAKTLSRAETTVIANEHELRRRIDVRYAVGAALPSLGAALALPSPAAQLSASDGGGPLASRQYRAGNGTYAEVLLANVHGGDSSFALEYSLLDPVSISKSAVVSERSGDAQYGNSFEVGIRNNLEQPLEGFPITLLQDADDASGVQVAALDAVQPMAVAYENAASVLSVKWLVNLRPLQGARFRVAYVTRSQAPVQAATDATDARLAALEAELAQLRVLAPANASNASAQQMLLQRNWSDAMDAVLDAKGSALQESHESAEALAARRAQAAARIAELVGTAQTLSGIANTSAITGSLDDAAGELAGVSYAEVGDAEKRIKRAEEIFANASAALSLLPDGVVAELNGLFDGFAGRKDAVSELLKNHSLATSFSLVDDALQKHAKKFATFSTGVADEAKSVLSALSGMRAELGKRSAREYVIENPSLRGDIEEGFKRLALLEGRMRDEMKKAAADANASLETARLAVAQASKILPGQKQLDSYLSTASKNYAEGRYVNSLVASDYVYAQVQDMFAAKYETSKARETNLLYVALPLLFFAALLVMFLRRGKHKKRRVIPNDEP